MVGTPASAALSAMTAELSPSMGMTTRTLAPRVSACSACLCCAEVSLLALKTSTFTSGAISAIDSMKKRASWLSHRGFTFSGSSSATQSSAEAEGARPAASASVAAPAARPENRLVTFVVIGLSPLV